MSLLDEISWAATDMPEAFEALLLHSDLPTRDVSLPPKPMRDLDMFTAYRKWVAAAARASDLTINEARVSGAELENFIFRSAPALLAFGRGGAVASESARVMVLLKREGKRVLVAGNGGSIYKLDARDLAELLQLHARAEDDALDQFFSGYEAVGEPILNVMRRQRRDTNLVGIALLLQIPPTRRFGLQARYAGLAPHVSAVVGGLLLQYGATALAWIALSLVALKGQVDIGRVTAWGLLLMMTPPAQFALSWGMGRIALMWGLALRRRLLEGTFRFPVDELRSGGVGASVALVNECQTLEGVALTQTIASFGASLDFLSAWITVILSPQWMVLGGLFLLTWMLAVWTARKLWRQNHRVSKLRSSLTGELIDNLVGHRTRLVQQPQERWHEGEDELLAEYFAAVATYDRHRTLLTTLPRVWLTIGAAVTFAYYVFSPLSSTSLLGLVAVVLGQASFTSFALLMPSLSLVAAAKQRVDPLIAAGLVESEVMSDEAVDQSAFDSAGPIVQTMDLEFEHRVGGRKILNNVGLTIHDGDHILLEGASGGGKTTLAAVLAGLRKPTAGVLLLSGLDQNTLKPEDWHHVVASAPQFNENHIFANTLAFNLLASRPWPPFPSDMADADEVCRELGLGPLIDRMPGGLQQFVGTSGWQLSHGERSRVFIARALLQKARLIILDESFGALDSETLEKTVACVIRRSPSLLVIAHR